MIRGVGAPPPAAGSPRRLPEAGGFRLPRADPAATPGVAGASAIGRATDSHVTFLRHADDGYLVMNAETRSFKRPEPRVIHVDWPDIAFDSTKDAAKLWNPKVKASKEE